MDASKPSARSSTRVAYEPRVALGTRVALGLGAALALAACSDGQIATHPDLSVTGVAIEAVKPDVILPGGALTIQGRNFLEPERGSMEVELIGGLQKADGTGGTLSNRVVATYQSETRADITINRDFVAMFGTGSQFRGNVRVIVKPLGDGREYSSEQKEVTVRLAETLTPSWGGTPPAPRQLCLNGAVSIDGGGYLLGGGEGVTKVALSGCFRPQGSSSCTNVNVETVALPASPFDRSRVLFRYPTSAAGIQPGHFDGTMKLRNVHASGVVTESATAPLHVDIVQPSLQSIASAGTSLGGYLFFDGCGFVGDQPGETTLLRVTSGTFAPDDGSSARPIALTLVPEFVSGERVRYVISESDALGNILKPRQQHGNVQLRVAPVIQKNGAEVAGPSVDLRFQLLPVRQVVVVEFLPAFRDAIARYGLGELEDDLKGCVRGVIRRTYGGVNVDVREVDPVDYALYGRVVIADTDPNAGLNRCGLDVSGTGAGSDRDRNNVRLDDVVGGFNATAGRSAHFGGVFPGCYLSMFSMHGQSANLINRLPPKAKLEAQTFDQLFDPVRAEVGGRAVTAAERAALQTLPPEDGANCPGPTGSRMKAVSCAMYTLCQMAGETASHEFGHTLGLANPNVNTDNPHNCSDGDHRLMDDGSARSFFERVPLKGDKPSLVCQDESDYLRTILPSSQPDPFAGMRPVCDSDRCRPSVLGLGGSMSPNGGSTGTP